MFHKVRWQLVALLFIAGIINYLDRAALSVAAPLITQELGLDPAQLGVVFSSFFFGYALFCFVGGYAADRYGPRLVIIVAMTLWSVFCGLTATATSVAALVVLRVIFGMGEGPFNTTMAKFIGNWFPKSEQASAIGIANSGTPLGGAIAGPIVGFIALSYGWRISFIAIAAIGLLWVLFWALSSTDNPAQHGRVSEDERAEIRRGQATETAQAELPLMHYLRQPAILATALAFFGYAYILYFFLSWFPSYLTMALHLSIQKMAIVSVIPWALGFVGLASGGFVCDALGRRLGDQVAARKLVMVVCLLVAAVAVALAGIATSLEAVIALIAIAVFFMYLSGSTYWAIILGLVESGRVGGVAGFVHLIANTAGIVAPIVTGVLVEKTGSFASAFVLAGGLATVGALLVALLVRGPSSRSAAFAQASRH
ncbi:MFS transporter [Bradyrhizobium sp. SK17]|uniref:MFS transporter n=1 Tax=Bradyrhizobium sp. SK17 TaxID=2057741 RepID=UPI000C308AEA|nr:MFS transporter [Bradyrhizobium sp. SK17]AUC93086.1 MFS transporter [Bradyrhizobium sp. SK17]